MVNLFAKTKKVNSFKTQAASHICSKCKGRKYSKINKSNV